MTSTFNFYELVQPEKGVSGGFNYKAVPKVTPKILSGGEPPQSIQLYDQPLIDRGKKRVSGPFTVEAVPSPSVKPIADIEAIEPMPADNSVTRFGETSRQNDWRDELYRTGIRGSSGQRIKFSRLEPLSGNRYLHAEGESRIDDSGHNKSASEAPKSNLKRVVVSFGPDHAPLEQRQVERSIEEAFGLMPRPEIIVFAAFQFDPEAAKDIDKMNWEGVTLFKVHMNADLLTQDLKSKRATNESFWLIGQPDLELTALSKGKDGYQVSVNGFDYYDTSKGSLESGGKEKIAMWMLDTDYDGRSLLPRQVFFPMAGDKHGWSKLAESLRTEIDSNLIEAYRGIVSLPFELGEQRRVAVKIIDNRGIESLKIIDEEIPSDPGESKSVSQPSLEDKIADIVSEIPAQEWDRIPLDAIENLDRYLYEEEYE